MFAIIVTQPKSLVKQKYKKVTQNSHFFYNFSNFFAFFRHINNKNNE
ncbi:MAG TPA: hypothetical protein DHV15_08490 [Treponema sp.]|uniref:Uncharacterized protein n=1 Tax=Treponema denticola (strain ATCC 35405 / DSM 14222 / CIP 103919 / JCM 8153 / KCTC 15104) TaxID=243275 RepID=Q73QN9_TREDE|nr:hypothetical protein TDE_0404 [Treponema denticola ATCC 35405]HCY95530.1 hypothetical protein [Treponema sp.]